MKHDQMIAVIEAHRKNPNSVEFKRKSSFEDWQTSGFNEGFDFANWVYRIIPPKPKMVKYYGWRVKASGQVLLLCGGETDTPPASRMERLPHLDCELPE